MVRPYYIGIDQAVGGFGLVYLFPSVNSYKAFPASFPLSKYGREVHQLRALEDHLISSLAKYQTAEFELRGICREGFAYDAKQSREKAGAVAYAVDSTLAEWLPAPLCYPTVVQPGQVKKFATGKGGKVSKEDVQAGVEALWGERFDNHNLADAYTLAQIAYSLDTDLVENSAQAEVLDKLRSPAKKKRKKS